MAGKKANLKKFKEQQEKLGHSDQEINLILENATKNKRGRPTSYDPKYCDELMEFMAQGYSYEAFAGKISVTVGTLYEWEKANKDFSEAKELAFAKNRIFWEGLGINNIINKTDSESFGEGFSKSTSRSLNSSVWVFNMKNRFKWRDKQPDENDVVINNSNSQVNLTAMTDEELELRIKEKLARNNTDES